MQWFPVYFADQLEPNFVKIQSDLLKEPFAAMTARQQYSLGQSPGDANLSFLVDDTGDGVIAASYPINATEASYEMPTAWQLVPSTTGRLTFNHVFHYHVVGASGNGTRYADPTSFSHNAPAPNARSIDPSGSSNDWDRHDVRAHGRRVQLSLKLPKRFSISGTALQGLRDGPRLRGAECRRFAGGRCSMHNRASAFYRMAINRRYNVTRCR